MVDSQRMTSIKRSTNFGAWWIRTTIDLDISTLGCPPIPPIVALKWHAPKDLSDGTGARMDIKRAVGATAVLSPAQRTTRRLEIDAATGSVWIRLSPTALSTAGGRQAIITLTSGDPARWRRRDLCGKHQSCLCCRKYTTFQHRGARWHLQRWKPTRNWPTPISPEHSNFLLVLSPSESDLDTFDFRNDATNEVAASGILRNRWGDGDVYGRALATTKRTPVTLVIRRQHFTMTINAAVGGWV